MRRRLACLVVVGWIMWLVIMNVEWVFEDGIWWLQGIVSLRFNDIR